METIRNTVEAVAINVANKATGAGSAVTIWGWFTASDLGMWIGIAIGLAGLWVNWYFKNRADKRGEELHQAQLIKVKSGWDGSSKLEESE